MVSALRKRPRDQHSFFRRFLDDPKRTGAVAPSSPFLAREMARAVDVSRPGLVVELGPGTGPVTKALLARGVARERLVLVEYDAQFCRMLAERFAARVVRGDAYALGATLGDVNAPVAAVVSSLPLLNESPARRRRLIEEAFDLMGPDGVFVQFTYGFKSPIPREDLGAAYIARSGPPVLRNLPPASVWTYRRRGADEPKVMKLKDHVERFGAEWAEKRRAAEAALKGQGDKVKDHAERLGAEFAEKRRAAEALLKDKGDKVKEIWKRETAALIRLKPPGERRKR